MSTFWQIWATIASFGTIGIVLVLAVTAPSFLGVVAEWAKPVAAKLGELAALGIHWLINILRVGVPHIVKSVHAMLVVALLMGGVWVYKDWTAPQVDTVATCQKVIKNLRKDFEFKPRKKPQADILKPSTWWPF